MIGFFFSTVAHFWRLLQWQHYKYDSWIKNGGCSTCFSVTHLPQWHSDPRLLCPLWSVAACGLVTNSSPRRLFPIQHNKWQAQRWLQLLSHFEVIKTAFERVLVAGLTAFADIYISFPEMSRERFQQSSVLDSVHSSIDYNFFWHSSTEMAAGGVPIQCSAITQWSYCCDFTSVATVASYFLSHKPVKPYNCQQPSSCVSLHPVLNFFLTNLLFFNTFLWLLVFLEFCSGMSFYFVFNGKSDF